MSVVNSDIIISATIDNNYRLQSHIVIQQHVCMTIDRVL